MQQRWIKAISITINQTPKLLKMQSNPKLQSLIQMLNVGHLETRDS